MSLTSEQLEILSSAVDYLRADSLGTGQLDERTVTKLSLLWEPLGYRSQLDLMNHLRDEPILTLLASFLGLASTPPTPMSDAVNVPIGSIIAWDKSLTGVPTLPAGFVECNGQVINDAASPLNGVQIRDLNSFHYFLRGNQTSGATGGNPTHAHAFTATTGTEDGDVDVQSDSGTPITVASFAHVHSVSGTSDLASSLPPFMNMVWIMRIK